MKMWDTNAFECESCTFECQNAQKNLKVFKTIS
jgi:hypothetical protein